MFKNSRRTVWGGPILACLLVSCGGNGEVVPTPPVDPDVVTFPEPSAGNATIRVFDVSEFEYPTDTRIFDFYGKVFNISGNQPLLPAIEVKLGERVVYTRTINDRPPHVETTNEAVTRKKSWVLIRNQSEPRTNRVYPVLSSAPITGAIVRFMYTNDLGPVDLKLVNATTNDVIATLATGLVYREGESGILRAFSIPPTVSPVKLAVVNTAGPAIIPISEPFTPKTGQIYVGSWGDYLFTARLIRER